MGDSDIGFYGVKVPPGKAVDVVAQFDDDFYETIHLTQVALGENAKPGPHTIFVQTEGSERFAIGTLDRERCAQFSVDVTLATDAVAISHTGKTDVYVTGYKVKQPVMDSEDEEDMYRRYNLGSDEDMSEEDSEGGEDSEDGEEAPQGVPFKGQKARVRVVDDEAEEGSESEDEESEEESDEDEGMRALLRNGIQPQKGKQAQVFVHGSDDEEEEESDEEEEEEESEEEEEPPKPAAKPAKAKAGDKRPAAPQPVAKTPQPAKKAKADAGAAKAPATAPAKVGAAGGASASAGEYVAALKTYLQANGPQKLASLGSKVKRPDSMGKHFKLKQLLTQNAAVFKYDQNTDQVSLA